MSVIRISPKRCRILWHVGGKGKFRLFKWKDLLSRIAQLLKIGNGRAR